jgi:hypothetical protein
VITQPKDITISDRMAEEITIAAKPSHNGRIDWHCPANVRRGLRSRGLLDTNDVLTEDGREVARLLAGSRSRRTFTFLRPNGGRS